MFQRNGFQRVRYYIALLTELAALYDSPVFYKHFVPLGLDNFLEVLIVNHLCEN